MCFILYSFICYRVLHLNLNPVHRIYSVFKAHGNHVGITVVIMYLIIKNKDKDIVSKVVTT